MLLYMCVRNVDDMYGLQIYTYLFNRVIDREVDKNIYDIHVSHTHLCHNTQHIYIYMCVRNLNDNCRRWVGFDADLFNRVVDHGVDTKQP